MVQGRVAPRNFKNPQTWGKSSLRVRAQGYKGVTIVVLVLTKRSFFSTLNRGLQLREPILTAGLYGLHTSARMEHRSTFPSEFQCMLYFHCSTGVAD